MESKENITETYKSKFISEFMKYFPGYYEEDELRKIIDENVLEVKFVDNLTSPYDLDPEKGILGTYCNKTIEITSKEKGCTFSDTLFHEFIHALRYNAYQSFYTDINNNNLIPGVNTQNLTSQFSVLDEGFVNEITTLYHYRKNEKGKINPGTCVIYDTEKLGQMYDFISIITQQYTILYKYLDEDSNLLNEYIKGKNIVPMIFQIYYRYIGLLNEKLPEEEKLTEKEQLSLTARALYYEVQFLNLIKREDDINLINNVIKKINNLHNQMNIEFAASNINDPLFNGYISTKYNMLNQHVFAIKSKEELLKGLFVDDDIDIHKIEDALSDQSIILEDEDPLELIRRKK